MEKASTENSSTGEQGWKIQVRKNRVRNNNAVVASAAAIHPEKLIVEIYYRTSTLVCQRQSSANK